MVLDFAVNVIDMTCLDVLAMIAFVSFDTNGTMLVAGVFSRAMKDIPNLKRSIKNDGLYNVLVGILLEIASDHGSTVPGSSQRPRYNYPSHRRPMSSVEAEKFVKKAFKLCNTLRRAVLVVDKNAFKNWKAMASLPIDCKSVTEYKAAYRDALCHQFLKDIADAAGNGVGHILSLTFFQLCTLLGVLPPFLYGWASITRASGGFTFIERCVGDRKDSISVNDANCWMRECNQVLSSTISANAHLGLIENILCELKREQDSNDGQSRKKYCLFVLDHRRKQWQNMYRLEFKSPTNIRLYIHPGEKGLKAFGSKKVSMNLGSWKVLPSSKIDELEQDHHVLCWNNGGDKDANTLSMNSKIHVSSGLMDCFAITR